MRKISVYNLTKFQTLVETNKLFVIFSYHRFKREVILSSTCMNPKFVAPEVDLNKLKQEFKKHVQDYMEDLDGVNPLLALHFCVLLMRKIQS